MEKKKDYVSPSTREMGLKMSGVIAQSGVPQPQGDWFKPEQVW